HRSLREVSGRARPARERLPHRDQSQLAALRRAGATFFADESELHPAAGAVRVHSVGGAPAERYPEAQLEDLRRGGAGGLELLADPPLGARRFDSRMIVVRELDFAPGALHLADVDDVI